MFGQHGLLMGGSRQFNLSYLGYNSSTAGSNSYTWSGASLGDPDADRSILVCAARGGFGSFSLVSCTVGGVSASILGSCNGNNSSIAMALAKVPLEAAGDVVVQWNAGNRHVVGIYRLTGVDTAYDTDFPAGGGRSTRTATVDILDGGAAVGFAFSPDSSGTVGSWSSGYDTIDLNNSNSERQIDLARKVATTGDLLAHDMVASSVRVICAASFILQ